MLSVPSETARSFMIGFMELVQAAKGKDVDPAHFEQLTSGHAVTGDDCLYLADTMLRLGDPKLDYRRIFAGRKLLVANSRGGHLDSTLLLLNQAYLQARAKRQPQILRSLELRYAKEHLRKAVASGESYQAMVLDGRLARVAGDETRAIEMWTKAMAAAVSAAALKTSEKYDETGLSGLNSPWIDLMILHRERSERNAKIDEWDKCWWAIEIGCEQDDPLAHYYASTWYKEKKFDPEGYQIPTTSERSEWLYHISKAAASGHPKAMHELGEFYATSSWKYISDEPPEHLKPTPFDSYPATAVKPLWNKIRIAIGLDSPPKLAPSEIVFHTAIFPDKAQQRIRLAVDWLLPAARWTYVPSRILLARIYAQEKLLSQGDAPLAALRMSDDRYTYASKADFDAGQPIQKQAPAEPEEIPNPLYAPLRAKAELAQVFYAYEAHRLIDPARADYAARRRRGATSAVTHEDEIISEEAMQSAPNHIRSYFRFPDVREMYAHEMENLYQEAKDMCDENEWDLYDGDGALVYRARLTKSNDGVAAGAAR